MCAAVLDNWFGIDRPTPAPQATPIAPLPPQIANPNAGDTQVNLGSNADVNNVKAKRRGAGSLRIDRATAAPSGLNIPQA